VLYTYDSMNRLTAVETPISSSITDYTTYTYDLAGNITQMNAGGRKSGSTITSTPSTTTYTYDRFGNMLTEKNAANVTESYTYDLNGAMLSKTDRKGVPTLYTYDNRGRLLTETVGNLVHSYTYGLNGALLNESKAGSSLAYVYDGLGRLTQESHDGYVKNYAYNIGDLRTAFTLKSGSTSLLSNNYTYDVLGRLSSVSGSGATASYTYDANNNLTGISQGNGVTQSYSYNAGNLVTQVGAAKGTTSLTRFQYTYDLAGRQISIAELDGDNTFYNYDAKGQLTSDIRTSGTTVQSHSKIYTYDPRGNRLTLANNGTTTSYTYNAVNHLQNSITSGTATAYTYDANGNTLTDKVGSATATTYTYNADDQLTGVSGTTTASYTYYTNGLRKTKTVSGLTTTYVWDGDQLVYETGSGTTKKYIRGLSLVACVEGSAPTYYQHDAHGNVVALTNSSGTVTRTYEYDAFGNQLNIDPTDTNPFRYCGEYWDAETGSYYLRARYYDSSIGRFTQEDPHWNTGNMVYGDDPAAMSRGMLDLEAEYYLPSVLATRQSGNLYIYCINDPIRCIDPSGEGAILAWLVANGVKILGSTFFDGIVTGITYSVSNRSFWAGLVNGGVSGLTTGVASAFFGVPGDILGAAVGSGLGTLAETYFFSDGNVGKNALIEAAITGTVSSIPSVYWDKAIGMADELYSIARELMKYDEDFGKMIKYFFDGIMSAMSAM